MALRLYYILTVHHDTGDDSVFDPLTQQKLMGFALKTFHDFPVITDRTRINGTDVLANLSDRHPGQQKLDLFTCFAWSKSHQVQAILI